MDKPKPPKPPTTTAEPGIGDPLLDKLRDAATVGSSKGQELVKLPTELLLDDSASGDEASPEVLGATPYTELRGMTPETLQGWKEVEEIRAASAKHIADTESATKIRCAELEKEAGIETAKATHEVPAKEATKQVLISSLKEGLQYLVLVVFCSIALWIAASKLTGNELAWAIAAIVGVFSAGLGGVAYINKKKKDDKGE